MMNCQQKRLPIKSHTLLCKPIKDNNNYLNVMYTVSMLHPNYRRTIQLTECVIADSRVGRSYCKNPQISRTLNFPAQNLEKNAFLKEIKRSLKSSLEKSSSSSTVHRT